MRHIEMHLIENSHEERLATLAGLDVYEDELCSECKEAVGSNAVDHEQQYKPFLIVLDDDSEWIVCKDCASAVL